MLKALKSLEIVNQILLESLDVAGQQSALAAADFVRSQLCGLITRNDAIDLMREVAALARQKGLLDEPSVTQHGDVPYIDLPADWSMAIQAPGGPRFVTNENGTLTTDLPVWPTDFPTFEG